MVDYLINRLTLKEYAHRVSGTYSGGNKRKLSVAIALIGVWIVAQVCRHWMCVYIRTVFIQAIQRLCFWTSQVQEWVSCALNFYVNGTMFMWGVQYYIYTSLQILYHGVSCGISYVKRCLIVLSFSQLIGIYIYETIYIWSHVC